MSDSKKANTRSGYTKGSKRGIAPTSSVRKRKRKKSDEHDLHLSMTSILQEERRRRQALERAARGKRYDGGWQELPGTNNEEVN